MYCAVNSTKDQQLRSMGEYRFGGSGLYTFHLHTSQGSATLTHTGVVPSEPNIYNWAIFAQNY